jgi:hypothetical protein
MANWQKALDRSLNWVDEHTRVDNKGAKTAKDPKKTGTAHGEKGERSAKKVDGNDSGGNTANSTMSGDKGATQDHGKSKVRAASIRCFGAQPSFSARDGLGSFTTHHAQIYSRPRVISALQLLVILLILFSTKPCFPSGY